MLAADIQKQILIIDRDIAAAEPLRLKLGDAGFIAGAIADAAAAIAAVRERPPHLVVIDWNSPGCGAMEIIETVTSTRGVRLIILSALSEECDIVRGLNLGADDYISKPFSLREAVARICMVLRARTNDRPPLATSAGPIVAGRPQVNPRSAEYRLLDFFMAHPGRAFNRTQLIAQVWGGNCDVDERTVDVNVQRLRKVLARPGSAACIQTVRGIGYRFVATRT
jgi:two-component system, OmpR family, phosphate regulon response regulator PhoB